MKLSLGCGFKYDGSTFRHPEWDDDRWNKEKRKIDEFKGYIGIDKADYGQHYVRDLRRGLPFADNSVEFIYADSSLEHIPHGEHFGENDFCFVMNECLRVLKPKCRMLIYVPYWSAKTAFKDPTHCRYFCEDNFSYMEAENAWEYGFDKGWKVIKAEKIGEVIEVELEKV